jgi:hypothetical protein
MAAHRAPKPSTAAMNSASGLAAMIFCAGGASLSQRAAAAPLAASSWSAVDRMAAAVRSQSRPAA